MSKSALEQENGRETRIPSTLGGVARVSKTTLVVASVPKMCTAILVVGLLLSCPQTVTAAREKPRSAQRLKEKLEVKKLELEIAQLKEKNFEWLTGLLGLLAGVAGTATSLWLVRRTRLGELDQAVHEKRLEFYPELVNATSHLALYFPPVAVRRTPLRFAPARTSVRPKECAEMGHALSAWYFRNGLLLVPKHATRTLSSHGLLPALHWPNRSTFRYFLMMLRKSALKKSAAIRKSSKR